MEKRSIALRSVFFVLTAALVCICMLMNWFPVDLNLGVVQLDEVFGTVNPLTLSGMLSKIEEALGSLAGFLPEEYETLKGMSTLLMMCGYATIVSYVFACVLHMRKNNKATELVSLVSASLAIITSVAFSNLIKDVYTFTGSSTAGDVAHEIVMKSPCVVVLFGGIASAICTEMIAECMKELVVGLIESIVATVAKIVNVVIELVITICSNIGFVLSDCAGAFLGILAGTALMRMLGSVLLSVLVGLGVAGLAAAACMVIASKLFYRNR